MKYIDADLLRKEIERRITDNTFGAKLELIDILAWLDTLSEEPDKSLEEAAEEYTQKMLESWRFDSTGCRPPRESFIAGAEWQAEKDARDMYMSDNRHYEKVYQLGKKDMKEQMLKDAVEGYVNYYEDSGGILMAEAQVGCPYHSGDKVRIVVLKEEK